jgi:hypothetical protein
MLLLRLRDQDRFPSKGWIISDNVSAVYEPPEPTARAAQEVPRLSRAIPFIGCVAGARKRAVRNTQRVI